MVPAENQIKRALWRDPNRNNNYGYEMVDIIPRQQSTQQERKHCIHVTEGTLKKEDPERKM